jgi:xylulokinase
VDVGTTHCKAGLFEPDGTVLNISSRPMRTRRAGQGYSYFEPEELWSIVSAVIRKAAASAGVRKIAALGIASMAETGLLVEKVNGKPRSVFFPWFDTSATEQAELLQQQDDPQERFCKSGIRPSFKCSLAKLLWLRERQPGVERGAIWLSVADYVAFRLTGRMATDYSLAGRTYAFRLDRRSWDEAWLDQLGLEPGIFPQLLQAGTPLGEVRIDLPGLSKGTPVAVTGHDHICAAFAAGAILSGEVFNSIGTAETLLGAIEQRPLGIIDYQSGLSYGCHTAPGQFYWLGGQSASGGSVEWLRSALADPSRDRPLSYDEMDTLAAHAAEGPTKILYFPYLVGSGSPHSDLLVRGAFVGLSASHGRAELLKAVLEGTGYEMEFIRRAAEQTTGLNLKQIQVAGGGVRNRAWMQIRADITGSQLSLLGMPEATLLGAAVLAGAGSGFYGDVSDAKLLKQITRSARPEVEEVFPDEAHHLAYQDLYEHGYLAFQDPLRDFGHSFRENGRH